MKRMTVGFNQLAQHRELLINQFNIFKKYSNIECFSNSKFSL